MQTRTPLMGCFGRLFFSTCRNASQLFFIDLGVEILRRVATGRVDEDGVLGEPPVAVARAADAGDGGGRRALRERELEARIDQRGGFSRARRPNDDVPGQIVEEIALRAGRLLERRKRIVHFLLKHRAVVIRLSARLAVRSGHPFGEFLGLLAARPKVVDAIAENADCEHRDDDAAHHHSVERSVIADGDHWQRIDDQHHACEKADPHSTISNDGRLHLTSSRSM